MTPVGQVDAAGKIARAWTRGNRRQRRAAAVFLVVAAIPAVIAVGAVLVSAMT
jgi:hypothetical protein